MSAVGVLLLWLRTNGSGTALPWLVTVKVGATISVSVRSPAEANSETEPATSTASPGGDVRDPTRPDEDEDALGGCGIRVGGRVLKEEAANGSGAPDRGHDAVGDHGLSFVGRLVTGALDLVDLQLGADGGPLPPPDPVGVGSPAVKSTELWSVSVPAALRESDVVLLNVGAGAPSAQLAVVP